MESLIKIIHFCGYSVGNYYCASDESAGFGDGAGTSNSASSRTDGFDYTTRSTVGDEDCVGDGDGIGHGYGYLDCSGDGDDEDFI